MGEFRVPNGDWVLIAAALVSIQFAQGRGAEELGFLAAFFSVLGDNLALLALSRPDADTVEAAL